MAMQFWAGPCHCYRFGACGPPSAQAEQSGETVSLIFLSQLSQIYRPNSAQTEQSGETASLISLSQHFQFHFGAKKRCRFAFEGR